MVRKLSVLVALLLWGAIFLLIAFQSSPSPYDADQFTRIAVLETKVAQIIPTQEFFVTDTPAPSPSPTYTITPTITPPITATPQYCYGRGTVNTPNSRLRVRGTPNGAVTRYLEHGASVVFSTRTESAGGLTWVELSTGGYVALEFITQSGLITCR